MMNQIDCVDTQGLDEALDTLRENILVHCEAKNLDAVHAEMHEFYRFLGTVLSMRKHGESLGEDEQAIVEEAVIVFKEVIDWLTKETQQAA